MNYGRVEFVSLYFITLVLNFLPKEEENSISLPGMKDYGNGLIKYALYKPADTYFFMSTKSFGINCKLINSKCNLISN